MSLRSILPSWKIQREWLRLKQQVSQVEWLFFGAMRRASYDRNRHKLVSVTEGNQPLCPDVAVILIFQPKGILPSLIEELTHFTTNGISPVVISNCPLSVADRGLLQAHCHLVIERPNFGYDFGGYREGILVLSERGAQIRNLFVKNDSIWFPVSNDCTLLDRALESKSDIYGIYLNETPKQAHRAHLQSYFYRFSPRLVNDPIFLDYWRNILLTDNKFMVIRQCEMKLTEAFRAKGFSIEPLYRMSDMQTALKALSNAELEDVLHYQIQVDTRSIHSVGGLMGHSGEPGWREKVEALIDQGKVGKYFLIAHPLALIQNLHCPILKKDRQPMYRLQRAEISRAGMAMLLPDVVRSEIMTWDAA
ncbi:rhamnan synthesis F family protein [Fuscibacter oryzae]|uniref:Lipopolysaccharide biosynthesis-like protein n=1 Tax=Fuscibacter oryzae TaxID=2803939 RepID=A0A8J7MQB7_9RHOB|nr:rhamnan synthesis F family protein [Fuscibacter oryzae]MBL4926815.1 lipopolysaccharide biosynthesis-like protein [Fuscibacter oryzae]